MPKCRMGHLVYNINLQNISFYRDLFGFLGWSTLYDVPEMLGISGEHGTSIWFGGANKDLKNDYDAPGLNHLGLNVDKQADVDEAAAYLGRAGVACLFETPRHRAEFSSSADSTYYQIMFESPDRILFEIVYTGKIDN